MNIGNITSDNFNLDGDGKDMQIEVYEQLIDQLQKENKQLKIQIRAREEKYRKLEDKYKELDKMCELYSKSLYNAELNQYKDNWSKLKEYLETNWKESQDIWFVKIINKMQELEQGSDSNVKD